MRRRPVKELKAIPMKPPMVFGQNDESVEDLQKLARQYAKAAFETLVEGLDATKIVGGRSLIEHPDYAVRATCAGTILDRGFGRAVPANEHQTNGEKAHLLSLQARKLEAEIKVLEAQTNPTDTADIDPNSQEFNQLMREKYGPEARVFSDDEGSKH